MYFVYILLSKDRMHWYIGSCANISDRLYRHNAGYSFSTKCYRPWELVFSEKFETRSEAFKREMFLKSPSGYQEYLKIKKEVLIHGGFA